MAPLKFRAWDTTGERWVLDEEMIFRRQKIFPGNPFFCKNESIMLTMILEKTFLHDLQTKYVVEQFTGILDKNGKEIFEGDIVTTDYAFSKPGRVKWLEWGQWVFEARRSTDDKIIDSCFFGHIQHIEVIGNIHENPALVSEV